MREELESLILQDNQNFTNLWRKKPLSLEQEKKLESIAYRISVSKQLLELLTGEIK